MNHTQVKESDSDFLTKLKKFIDNNYLKDFDEIKLQLDNADADFFISFNNWHKNNIELKSTDIFKNVLIKMFKSNIIKKIENKELNDVEKFQILFFEKIVTKVH